MTFKRGDVVYIPYAARLFGWFLDIYPGISHGVVEDEDPVLSGYLLVCWYNAAGQYLVSFYVPGSDLRLSPLALLEDAHEV